MQRVRHHELLPGDRVLSRNLGAPGKHKLDNIWKSEPYLVKQQLPGLPTYEVRPESGCGPVKILHRNHLLPISQSMVEAHEEESNSDRPVQTWGQKRSRAVQQADNERCSSLDTAPLLPLTTSSDESEDEREYGHMPATEFRLNGQTMNPDAADFIPTSFSYILADHDHQSTQ